MMRSIYTIAALILGLFVTAPAFADAEWFSQSGFKILEAVGLPELGYVLIGQDDQGAYHLLKEGDNFQGKFTVNRIGEQQVRVDDADGTQQVSMILHRNVPADLLLLAIGALHQRNVIMAAKVDGLKAFTPDLLIDPQRLADFAREDGLDVRAQGKVLLVRTGTFPQEIPQFESDVDDGNLEMVQIHSSLDAICLAANAGGTPIRLSPESPFEGPVSVHAPDISPRELAHYLKVVTGVEIDVEEIKKPTDVAAADAPTSRDLDPKEKQILIRARALFQAGKHAPAFKLFAYLTRTYGQRTAYYDAMGQCAWKMGKKTLAARAFAKAYKMDPKDALARKGLMTYKSLVLKARAAAATPGQG